MDFNLKFSLKSCCLYEQLSHKSFWNCTAEDADLFIYCMLLVAGFVSTTYDTFKSTLSNSKIRKQLTKQYNEIIKMLGQFKQEQQTDSKGEEDNSDTSQLTITKIASALIVQHHIDAHYVMYEMDLWELWPYLEVAQQLKKDELVEKRFWTYMQIAPHIDTKKVKTPQALIPFEWEKDEQQAKKLQELKNNENRIMDLIGKENGWNDVINSGHSELPTDNV